MFADLRSALRPTLAFTLFTAVLLGIAYPLALTGVAQVIFPHQANGSLVGSADHPIGSELIGQGFASPRYFHGRPSAAGKGYDATASSGSNLGPASQALADRLHGDLAALPRPATTIEPIPADLVTASASGLDPDISPEAALYQAPRIAATRGVSEASVRALIASTATRPLGGVLGDAHVNVLALNRALDASPKQP